MRRTLSALVVTMLLAGCAGAAHVARTASADDGDPALTTTAACLGMAGPAPVVVDLHPADSPGHLLVPADSPGHLLVPADSPGHLLVPAGGRVLVRTQRYQRSFSIPVVTGGPAAGSVLVRLCAARQGFLDEAVFAAARPGLVNIGTHTDDCGQCSALSPSAFVRVAAPPRATRAGSPLDLLDRLRRAHVACLIPPVPSANTYLPGFVQVSCSPPSKPGRAGEAVTLRVYDSVATHDRDLAGPLRRGTLLLDGPNWAALPAPGLPVTTLQLALGGRIRS